jgi:hypothetical protein
MPGNAGGTPHHCPRFITIKRVALNRLSLEQMDVVHELICFHE